MTTNTVPTFYLYGEPHQSVGEDFVHVERLDDRSRPSEWTIRDHSHSDLHQFLMVDVGGGTMRTETGSFSFAAPALMLVPATVIHGFDWHDESSGWVLTAGRRFVDTLTRRHPELGALLEAAQLVPLTEADAAGVNLQMGLLRRELGWAAKGYQAAIEAAMLHLMVVSLRAAAAQDALASEHAPSPAAALVARYRERLETRFHLRERIADHAAALGVSESALRSACARIAARSPAAILDDRAVLEARRMLLYSNLSVAEIGYTLGFDDPAYFSRFFARRAGLSPARFRRDHTTRDR